MIEKDNNCKSFLVYTVLTAIVYNILIQVYFT